jgi:hypothetical protein
MSLFLIRLDLQNDVVLFSELIDKTMIMDGVTALQEVAIASPKKLTLCRP